MSIAEQIIRAKNDYDEVYEAGKQAENDRFWDAFQTFGNKKDYSNHFFGSGWTAQSFKPKYKPMKPTGNGASKMFMNFSQKRTEERTSIDPTIVDFSECTYMDTTFKDSTFDTVIADCSNAKTLNSTFNMGNGTSYGIRKIVLKVTEVTTAFNATFDYNSALEEMIFTEDSVIGANIKFAQCNKLTHDSLKSIINALKLLVTYEEVETKATDYYLYGGPPIEAQVWEAGVWYKIQRTSGSYVYFDSVTYGDLAFEICDKTTGTEADASTVIGDATHIKIEEDGVVFWLKTTKVVSSGETKTLTLPKTFENITEEQVTAEIQSAKDKGWNVVRG